jgi:hypothetical protein
MGSDPVAGIVSWFLMVLAAAIVLPIALAVGLLMLVGLGLWKALNFGYDLVRGDAVERKLMHVARERDSAIADIVRLRNEGQSRLRAIPNEHVIESPAEGWGDD